MSDSIVKRKKGFRFRCSNELFLLLRVLSDKVVEDSAEGLVDGREDGSDRTSKIARDASVCDFQRFDVIGVLGVVDS